jgi:hypothetical protein
MTDFLGYGKEKRRAGNLEILSGRVTFRYAAVAVSCSVQSAAPSFPTHAFVRAFAVQGRLSGDVGER